MTRPAHCRTIVWCAIIVSSVVLLDATGQSPMELLVKEYSAAAPSNRDQLLGSWILVLNINSKKFLTGLDGADSVLSDPAGVRDEKLGGRAYWELDISRAPDGALRAASRTTWMPDEVVQVAPGPDGDLRFTKDYGGDTGYLYRCRAVMPSRLVCLLDEPHSGHGVAFRRVK